MNDHQLLEALSKTDVYPSDSDMPTAAWDFDVAARELERRTKMPTEQPTKAQPATSNRRGFAIALAAFAVVIAVAGIALLSGQLGSDTEPPAVTTTLEASPSTSNPSTTTEPTTSSTEATTTIPPAHLAFIDRFETAFNAGDEETLLATFAPGAYRELADQLAAQDGADVLVRDMIFLHERGTTMDLVDCRATSNGISCTTTQSGPVEDALYQVPVVSRDTFDLDAEGRITVWHWGVNDPVGVGRDPDFHDWMNANHPEAAANLTDCCWWSRITGEDAWVYAEWIPVWVEAGRPSG